MQFKKIIPLLAIAAGLSLTSEAAISAGAAHYLGLSYVSGATDVWDWHEQNLRTEDVSGIPLGLSYRFAYQFESGFNLGAGIGPAVLILGDVGYHDVPFQFTVGYGFAQSFKFRPYARIGASYHVNDGDYIMDKAGACLLGAIGFEYGEPNTPSFFMEASVDRAEATFSTAQSSTLYATRFSQEDIAVSDFQLTLGMRF